MLSQTLSGSNRGGLSAEYRMFLATDKLPRVLAITLGHRSRRKFIVKPDSIRFLTDLGDGMISNVEGRTVEIADFSYPDERVSYVIDNIAYDHKTDSYELRIHRKRAARL